MTCYKHPILLNLKVHNITFKFYFSISGNFSNLPNSHIYVSGVLEIVVKDIESRDQRHEILLDCVNVHYKYYLFVSFDGARFMSQGLR